MIENANHAVSDIKVTHGHVLMELMTSDKFTPEQRIVIVEMLEPIEDAISIAQSKFSMGVNE